MAVVHHLKYDNSNNNINIYLLFIIIYTLENMGHWAYREKIINYIYCIPNNINITYYFILVILINLYCFKL